MNSKQKTSGNLHNQKPRCNPTPNFELIYYKKDRLQKAIIYYIRMIAIFGTSCLVLIVLELLY